MHACANAIPILKSDLRCSRACTLLAVGDLHIALGSGTSLMDSPRAEMLGEQLDLVLQQFDVPALRGLHVSHDFTGGNLDMLGAQWKSCCRRSGCSIGRIWKQCRSAWSRRIIIRVGI